MTSTLEFPDSPRLITTRVDSKGVVTLTLNRPEVNNAYNGAMLRQIHGELDRLQDMAAARVLVIRGAGRHFQAGADLGWISQVRADSAAANLEASHLTGAVVDRLNRLSLPSVAVVQGACFGGGTGLLAACDVVLAADSAMFSIAEVRWGLHASIIIPALNDAISPRQVRRYAMTAERFDALEARRIGLVHEVVPNEQLDNRTDDIVNTILGNAPHAMAETKACVLAHAWAGFNEATFDDLARSHAEARQADEGGEGLSSFVQHRPANWSPASSS